MSLEEIEHAVANLSRSDLQAFRGWFKEFDAAAWDEQFEKDVQSGKLDAVADRVLSDLRSGKCSEL